MQREGFLEAHLNNVAAAVMTGLGSLRGNEVLMDAAFHPFKQLLASSADHSVAIWDLRQQRCTSTYTGHVAEVSVLCFSPDGKLLVSGSRDGEVKVNHLLARRQ